MYSQCMVYMYMEAYMVWAHLSMTMKIRLGQNFLQKLKVTKDIETVDSMRPIHVHVCTVGPTHIFIKPLTFYFVLAISGSV